MQLTTHNPLVEGVLELSLRSATGAVPGQVTLLARLPDQKLHALSVDSHVLQLPSIPAASTHVVQVRGEDGCCRAVQVPASEDTSGLLEHNMLYPFAHVCSHEDYSSIGKYRVMYVDCC